MSKRKNKPQTLYRSKFEQKIADQLTSMNVPFEYEKVRLDWIEPAKDRVYTPDYSFPDRNLILECKGFWPPQDRLKMLEVIRQYPNLDIRMVFQDASKKIVKGSKTTYAKWCEKYGIKFCHQEIPKEWLFENTFNTGR